ncbi:MAG: serine/threonine protein kinase [Cyanobacteria bacterium REEB67]|nr:serine/threonine protein kinase [Cyanobacteria bacterium REEB67]
MSDQFNDESNEANRKNDQETDIGRTRSVINQPTVPDKRLANFQGQATQIPGISGINLSYLPGDIVDNDYQLIKLLGRGGMGAVFSCRHLTLDREYAIKLLSAQQLSKEAWVRFQSEARALARLNHPNIVSIYNMGIDKQQCPYYVMDFLSGSPLDELIHKSGMLDEQNALDIFIQVAGALNSAHNQGIVHRDVKPSNVMVTSEPDNGKALVKIVDFGIARVSKQDLTSQSQTATGLIFGTPYYMSPEQCQGEKVDARSDIYSFGCALYEALTGRPPFVGDSAFHTFMMHQSDEPPPMRGKAGSKIAPELVAAVDKMLHKKPADRYQTMALVEQDLILIREDRSTQPAKKKVEPKQTLAAPIIADEDEDEVEAEDPLLNRLKKIGLVLGALGIIGTLLVVYLVLENEKHKKNNNLTVDEGVLTLRPTQLLRDFGASPEELQDVTNEKIIPLEESRQNAVKLYKSYQSLPNFLQEKFRRDGYFHFLPNVSLGSISIGDKKPVSAKGNIEAPLGVGAFLYLITPTRGFPLFLHKFGPDDLTGLAIVTDSPSVVLKEIRSWHHLSEIDFFNPLLKAMPDATEYWDESKIADSDLPQIDKLNGIKILGLCKPVSGSAILHMTLLNRLEGLNLKEIKDFEPLLQELPKYDNLKELTLIHQETKNEQLEYLSKMKNLEKLTIKRGFLTLNSLSYFQKMPALKYLRLDRNDWNAEEKANFQKGLPKVEVTYEPVAESTYWEM